MLNSPPLPSPPQVLMRNLCLYADARPMRANASKAFAMAASLEFEAQIQAEMAVASA